MAMKSLLDVMAELYSKRNRARDKFARIDNRKMVGVDNPEKFSKWKSAANELINSEKELLNRKVDAYENIYPFSTKAEMLSDKIYQANRNRAYKNIHKKQSDLFDEILSDWINTPDGQKWISSRPADGHDRGWVGLPSEQFDKLVDNDFSRRSRDIADNDFDISDELRASENVANSVAKDYKKYMEWNNNFRMPGMRDIQFTDKKGVKHEPMEYYYGSSFDIDHPWYKGKGLSDEDVRILQAFD